MKNKASFKNDIKTISMLLKQRDESFYNFNNKEIIEKILTKASLNINKENIFAIKQRIGFLRDDLFLNTISNLPHQEQIKNKEFIFQEIASLYQDSHQKLINDIKGKDLLTPFYRFIIQEVHNIGLCMSKLALKWNTHIQNIQKDLEDNIGNDKQIFEYLRINNLLDTNNGEPTDRSYSVLVKENNNYKVLSYIDAFTKEVKDIIIKIENTIDNLPKYKDDIFSQDKEFLEYFIAIKEAIKCKNIDNLISKYIQIDIKWMSLNSPIQIGHPLEYYEDKYRKSVAIEWDIRLSQDSVLEDRIDLDIKNLAKKLQNDSQKNYPHIYKTMQQNLSKVQLYLGRAMIFYGTSFNGMFSAQVVPNDESVSKVYGKKIFAFGESILQAIRAKPLMQIDTEVFDKDFLDKYNNFISTNENLWHKIYRISTIGHEYGHILWCDEDSEVVMNKNGNFKNVEEFKATAGGLLSYFIKNDNSCYEILIIDTIKRAIKLLAYFNHEDIRAYYMESLIHLDILFSTKILKFKNNKLQIEISLEKYKSLKTKYEEVYKDLVYNFYLPKNDPTIFLDKYISFCNDKKTYLPINKNIKDFVIYYQTLYLKIGSQVLHNTQKENNDTNK